MGRSSNRRGKRFGVVGLRIEGLGRGVQHVQQGLRGAHGLLQPGVHVGHSPNGASNKSRVDHKAHQLTGGQFSGGNKGGAFPNHGDQRPKQAQNQETGKGSPQDAALNGQLGHRIGSSRVALQFKRFPREGLNRGNALQGLFHSCIALRRGVLYFFAVRPDPGAKNDRQDHDHRQYRQHKHRQLRAGVGEQYQSSANYHDLPNEFGQGGGKGFLQHADVRLQPVGELAHPFFVEIGQGQHNQVPVHGLAQGSQRAFRYAFKQHNAQKGENSLQDQQPGQLQRQGVQGSGSRRSGVHQPAQQSGEGQVGSTGKQQHHQTQAEFTPVRANIRIQTAHAPQGLPPEGFFGRTRIGGRAVPPSVSCSHESVFVFVLEVQGFHSQGL